MNDELCKCGHLRTYHLNGEGRGRGRCTGEVRQFFRTLSEAEKPYKRTSDVILSKEHAELLYNDLKAAAEKLIEKGATSKYQRALKDFRRGYRIIACACPMFHLIELGQVKLYKPGE